MLTRRSIAVTVLIPSVVLGTSVVSAQDYPNKPIRIITVAAGGAADFTARVVAQGIAAPMGQPVIVDNRANGVIAGEIVSKAPPDGYTLTVAGGAIWLTPLLRKVSYDVVSDLSPISLAERSVSVVAVHPAVPVNSVKELIALAKAKPGELNYGSSPGGTSYLAAELFKAMAGINIVWVPYKGGAATITALVGGEVQLSIQDASAVAPHAKAGRLRALAVTSAEPTALAPGLPPVAASGLPGYESVNMTGIFAPAKTPRAIINRLNQEIVRHLNRPDTKERLFNTGVEVIASSPERLAAAMKSEMAVMGKVIKDAGIRTE